MIERKLANMPGWKRILQHRFIHARLDTAEFRGDISLYCMDAVRAPLIVEYFQRKVCIADAGYSWLKQYPAGEHFTVTAQFDDQARIAAWYIDLCAGMGVDENGIPWMDDLYLDLVVSPAREVEIKDADELKAARESGEITTAQFELAWSTANRIIEQIQRGLFRLLDLSALQRQMLLDSQQGERYPYGSL